MPHRYVGRSVCAPNRRALPADESRCPMVVWLRQVEIRMQLVLRPMDRQDSGPVVPMPALLQRKLGRSTRQRLQLAYSCSRVGWCTFRDLWHRAPSQKDTDWSSAKTYKCLDDIGPHPGW